MAQIFDPRFHPHLKALVDGSFTGACFRKVLLTDAQTSGPAVYCEQVVTDHWKIHLPFAGHTLVWEVRFDSNCPELAPDFLFDDDSFTQFLTIDLLSERVPSLINWNPSNPKCLRDVIQELMNLYTVYQLQCLEKDGSNIGDECSKLMQEFELREEQLQVLSGDTQILPQYLGSSTRPNTNCVSVMILQLEKHLLLDSIPEKYQQSALQIIFREYSPNTVMFHINPIIRHVLGIHTELDVPNLSKTDALPKYFHNFLSVVQEMLSQVTQSYEKRQDFHLGVFGVLSSLDNVKVVPLESDTPVFVTSSYMVEVNDYPVTIVVQTPNNNFGDPKISVRTTSAKSHDIRVESPWDVQKTVEALINCARDLREENNDDFQ